MIGSVEAPALCVTPARAGRDPACAGATRRRATGIAAARRHDPPAVDRKPKTMAQTTPATPAGAPRGSWFASLVRDAPYLVLIVLGLVGITWTSVARTPPTTYWVVLTPVTALICVAEGWRHSPSNARLRMAASQA